MARLTIQQRFFAICIACIGACWHLIAAADTFSLLATHPGQALGQYAAYMKETGSPLPLTAAADAYAAGKFTAATSQILTFGIGSQPVWIHLSVSNPTGNPASRRLLVENSWLDHLDVYFMKDGRLVESHNVGDSRPFGERPIRGRFFSFDHKFDAGTTDIYLRVETPDPIVIPLFLSSTEDAAQRETAQGYGYGFLYGYLMALLAYNILIYLGLKNKRHLLYAGFIAMFILTNIAYTGHGFAWLWPNHVVWQRWIIPIMMVLYGVSGLTFAKHFLDLRSYFPRVHQGVTWTCRLFATLLLIAVVAKSQLYALLVAFVFVTIFSFMMLALGLMSFYSGYLYSRYFLIASIASMLGTTITALSVWGFIPFSDWKFRAVEIGMLLDATLLALALANQLRLIQAEHKLAEHLAGRDPLTNLNNRRSFQEKAQPIWSTAQRNNRDLSVIILDIDHFKSINDHYGHATGDAALIAIGKVLSNSARDGDIVVRWGGEEFLLLLPETNLEAAIAMAERLRKAISEIRLPWENTEIAFTASFGVAHKTAHDSLDSLISEADSYLYQSKQRGRNKISSRPE